MTPVVVPLDSLIRFHAGVLAETRGYMTPAGIVMLEQTIEALRELKRLQESADALHQR